MSWLDEALEYRDRGWAVIPLIDKRPAIKWRAFQTELPSEETLAFWASKFPDAQLGLITGEQSGLVVLDCDNDEAIQFVTELGYDSPVKVKTKRGVHQYFRHPGGRVSNHQGGNPGEHWYAVDGLDLRGDGGYVRVPSSNSPDLVWQLQPHVDFADQSEWPAWEYKVGKQEYKGLLDLRGVQPLGHRVDVWTETAAYAQRKYPHGKLPTGAGNGRNDRVFKYLCQCILKGLRGEALEAEGRRFMETFFEEPLDEYYYRASLKSAWSLERRNHPERFDAQGNYIYLPPAEKPDDFDLDLSDVEPESTNIELVREPYRPLTDDDLELMKAKTKELQYLIRPWLTKGSITQVYGYTGHGKSTMLYRILYHLCVGRDFGRLFQIELPAKVLYFDWENSPHTLVNHIETMRDSYGRTHGNFNLWLPPLGDFNLTSMEGVTEFAKWVRAVMPDVVVIDTVRSAMGGLEENDAAAWAPFNLLLTKLRSAGFAVIWLHHANKPTQFGLGREAGSSNQLTVTETQIRVTQVFEDAKMAKEKGGKAADSFSTNVWEALNALKPPHTRLKFVCELTYGKTRNMTDEYMQGPMLVGLARSDFDGREYIVTSSSPRFNVYRLMHDGNTPEDTARMLGLSLRTVNTMLGIEE
ncbi:hypothetical protein HNP12_000662 [Aeromonas hydrophila]|uniref:AAA family ATPase n=1 Tax=Aeromonas hydrophila TaxID=644 RepID=UPI0021689781|nr:AAA family ATPase [Aeromonas hydrophila]MCS3766614.1 hypothetical protein [Aeromonas hydrophila]